MHQQRHRSHRGNWLRAAVLGANDGLVSTSSLIIGVAASGTSKEHIVLAGLAGLVAGAMSMAAGEYVSVSSQADAEKADLAMEALSLCEDFEEEKRELSNIYRQRGLSKALAEQVAETLMQNDPLGAHARDDIGISESIRANPLQAAFSSACMFVIGALLPLCLINWVSPSQIMLSVALSSMVLLCCLGAIAATLGGAGALKGAFRVAFWGGLAMLLTALVGRLFGVVV